MKRILAYVLLIGITLVVVIGCSQATPEPTPTPTPADYLNMASTAMADVQTAQFSLAREGTPLVLDPTLGAQFLSATGQFQAPDQVHASVKADISGNILNVDLLWLPEGNFMTNPLTGAYMPLEAALPLNPTEMFDPDVGLSHILITSVNDPAVVGIETIEGVETHHLTGTAEAEEVAVLAPTGLIGAFGIDLWLDTETLRVVRVRLTEQSGDSTVLDFFGYDESVDIPSPS
ncbi:MAG: LppX_LprAFG lipoprotein [Chloroflexota bacterium]|nr:MAG: LppX_LprAFG lipoprotein [Chloroflexota bacterium]